MKALITGISGQDGSYLSEYLLSLGYEVHGIVRRNSVCENQQSRLEHIRDKIKVYYGDVLDCASLYNVFNIVHPDEIYNLAAQSHVRISFEMPQFTIQANSLGTLNVLECFRTICPNARFYQAGSSEMFGNCIDSDNFQRETTAMHPVSPYGCSKLFAHSMVCNYRNSYGLFATNGILFNHESPRRGSNFVTNKVVKTAVEIKLGITDKLELGNMDSCRDWGCAKDYVRAMHLIINHHTPDDFVIATGRSRSVRELCDYVFTKLGMKYEDYVVQNQKYLRPEELKYLKGDATKAKTVLGWEPMISFENMLDEMISHWLNALS